MPSLLFDARLMLEKPTGIGQYISSLLPQLLQIMPDWQIHLLRRPRCWPDYQVATWQAPNLIHHLSELPPMSPRQHLEVPKLARQLGVDLLHYPHFDAPVWWQPVAVVATIHDAKYLVRPDFFTNLSSLKRLYMRLCFRATLRRAAAVIADSYNTAHDLQRLFEAPAECMTVVHLAADPHFQPATDQAIAAVRSQYHLVRPFVLTVGEQRPHKNHAGLLRAYAESQSRVTHDLVIVGRQHGDYTEPQELAATLGLSNQVHFLSRVDFQELTALYSGADLFVLPSLYEGFGLPVLEAMACGAPVVAAKTTSTGEIADGGAFLIDPENDREISVAIDRLLTDQPYRQALIAKGAAHRRTFTWRKTARQTVRLYEQVLHHTPPLQRIPDPRHTAQTKGVRAAVYE
ncbi:MAG: glycosyltransferase family 1 protein [Caldilineaceae bacterium]